MTVRLKITLLITAAGLLSSLVFSCIVLWEMLEQPFRIIDSDLESMARRAVRLAADPDRAKETQAPGTIDDERYWVDVRDQDSGLSVYRSFLARMIDIPQPPVGSRTMVRLKISHKTIELGQNSQNKVAFRVRRFRIPSGNGTFLVGTARPVENLEEELRDTLLGVFAGLISSGLLLAAISYFLASFMLKPVRMINAQARDISEKHLDRRMPVSAGRDEFNALAQTLNEVFDRLEHAFLQQKRLLADASHELKTPLTMMRLALEDIRSGYSETRPDPQAENHERMTEQALRMDRLVRTLLDLSALEIEAAAKTDPIDLEKILKALVAEYRFLAEPRDIRLDVHLPAQLEMEGDEEKLKRAFSNIIDNAVKYTEDGGRIDIGGDLSDKGPIITVCNTGPGVAEEEIPKVFDQFFRVERSRSLRHGGSGLGLAIVKRIVELHGGYVKFESRAGEWTRVAVHLPWRRHKSPE